eukprot:TRINITY_DN9743_c0_g1_i3.p1 TRINITY_DN9743_c0_g1~~TRINITY_DN9743_c0_g1_i3.p1  ORF type:complete len:356 (-),score=64.04 TRINITY_DN9743_c0_g1_i3:348-1343(-)
MGNSSSGLSRDEVIKILLNKDETEKLYQQQSRNEPQIFIPSLSLIQPSIETKAIDFGVVSQVLAGPHPSFFHKRLSLLRNTAPTKKPPLKSSGLGQVSDETKNKIRGRLELNRNRDALAVVMFLSSVLHSTKDLNPVLCTCLFAHPVIDVILNEKDKPTSSRRKEKSSTPSSKQLSTEEKLQYIDMYIGKKLATLEEIPNSEEHTGKFLTFCSSFGSLEDVLVLLVSLFGDSQRIVLDGTSIFEALSLFSRISFLQEPQEEDEEVQSPAQAMRIEKAIQLMSFTGAESVGICVKGSVHCPICRFAWWEGGHDGPEEDKDDRVDFLFSSRNV